MFLCFMYSQLVSAKKDCEEETRREKKGASHFFPPFILFVFFMCSVFLVFLSNRKCAPNFRVWACASFALSPLFILSLSFPELLHPFDLLQVGWV